MKEQKIIYPLRCEININLFNPRYVHYMWSEEIDGKECICEDKNIDNLIRKVNKFCPSDQLSKVYRKYKDSYQLTDGYAYSNIKFVYYDPNIYSKYKKMHKTAVKEHEQWKKSIYEDRINSIGKRPKGWIDLDYKIDWTELEINFYESLLTKGLKFKETESIEHCVHIYECKKAKVRYRIDTSD